MKTLLLDNYDSFTFNLYQEVGVLGGKPEVRRNDKITMDEVKKNSYTHILLGPGPGHPAVPRDIGISMELLAFAENEHVPLLGVCLGHQILGNYFKASVIRAPELCHGEASTIHFDPPQSKIFSGLPDTIDAMRYHSLCIENVRSPLLVTARTKSGIVMAVEHRSLPLFGVQFHPESIGTPDGKTILKNFLSLS